MVSTMRRTVRLATLELNSAKISTIRDLQQSYTDAKDRFLLTLGSTTMWRFLSNKHAFRDWAKDNDLYPNGVNVHLLDQAAFDAVDTWVRQIESVIAISDMNARIHRRFKDEDMRHYAYSVLTNYADIGLILRGGIPERPKIPVTDAQRTEVCRFLHRHLRDAFSQTNNPRAHLARSFSLDETMYTSFTVERKDQNPAKRQYVSIIGSVQGKRVVLPLSGISRVSGNIRVVLDPGSSRAFIHVSYEMKPLGEATGTEKAIDWGITEVATDQDNKKYGQGYGKVLEKITEQTNQNGKKRGKLHSLTKRQAGSKKAKHIARHNLGSKKQKRRRESAQATLRTITGSAVKDIVYGEGNRTRAKGRVPQIPSQRPSLIVCEDLSHLRGKAKSKKLSRLCSAWARSETQGRMNIHTHRGSSPTKAVNAAYTSQRCPEPDCGYVHKDNRNGDMFHCRNPYWNCNWQGGADKVAAMNLMARASDREITLYTPYRDVKNVLDARFQRRLESRTGDAGVSMETASDGVLTRVVEGDTTAHGRTPSEPRRVKPAVGDTPSVESSSPVHRLRTGETQRLESENKRMPRNV